MILGISGRKQSGKTTTGNFIISLKLAQLGISDKINLDAHGRIVVSDLFGDTNYAGPLDISIRKNDYMINKLHEILDPYIRVYSFADPLKQDICMNILGLTYDQCYGTDDDKNSLTDLLWEDIPAYDPIYVNKHSGKMTAREVMEIIGTDIFRKIKNDVWVESTLRRIKQDRSEMAIIVDCRFPNEVDSIKQNDGKVIRLTRNPFDSIATAETALDPQHYSWNNFDYICKNENMSIYDQCMDIQNFLKESLPL